MTLDGIEIRYPSKFSIEPLIISKKVTTASGKTAIDVIARKRQFTLSWNYMYGTDYKTIRDILDAGIFFTFVFPDNKTDADTKTVYAETNITGEIVKRTGNDWLYKDVQLVLEEQ